MLHYQRNRGLISRSSNNYACVYLTLAACTAILDQDQTARNIQSDLKSNRYTLFLEQGSSM